MFSSFIPVILSVLISCLVFGYLVPHDGQKEMVEQLVDALACLRRCLKVLKPGPFRPKLGLAPGYCTLCFFIHLVPTHGPYSRVADTISLCFLYPLIQRLKRDSLRDIEAQHDTLRVLVELVPDIKKLWVAGQIPEVDLDVAAVNDDWLDPKVHPDRLPTPKSDGVRLIPGTKINTSGQHTD